MNLAYKSPSHCEKNTNAYFTPSNNNAIDDENNGGGHTPYLTAPLNPTTILKQHQDFLHAIQSRHVTQPMVLSPPTVNNKQIKTTDLLSSIEHDQLIGLLSSKTLLLDVRSFVQYSHHHIRHSINVSIPNTILKRPTFTLDKIYEAIVLDDAKNKLKQWPMMKSIVFYDDQSQCILENSACAYLGTKLKRAGFKGKLCYLKGGFDLFHRFHPEYCEFTADNNRLQINLGAPTRSLIKKTQMNFNVGAFTAPIFENQAFNPFFSNIRQNMELSHGPISERFSIRAPSVYDYTKIPKWLEEATNENGPKRLAEAYENIEKIEQKRLQNIMYFHSNCNSDSLDFRFSITAGIEKGTLNRYTNIWPYEYTRVKIQQPPTSSSDYINASHIQYKDYQRYISTQGPLPTTFNDFWQMVWEQDSRVIVMLTNEEEMSKIKCHRYWPQSTTDYGNIKVVLLSEIEHDEIITRKLQLIHQDAIREITHLQYTGWMDFNVPENPLGLLQVVSMANENRTDSPIIVHCSAGCGRSGAFCVIDTVISRLKKEEGDQDVLLETISCFREQRLSMVQTLRQFVFCYEVILWLMGLD